MSKHSEEWRERVIRLSNELLEQVEDKTNPRYLELKAQFAEEDAEAERAATQSGGVIAR
jgi:hypothetical protein